MVASERMSVSFDEGERQALAEITEVPELAEVFWDRASRLRHRVPVGGDLLSVEDLGDSASDVVRALVRIGLDAVARQHMALKYLAAAPALTEVMEDKGLAALFAASQEALGGVDEVHARRAGVGVRIAGVE